MKRKISPFFSLPVGAIVAWAQPTSVGAWDSDSHHALFVLAQTVPSLDNVERYWDLLRKDPAPAIVSLTLLFAVGLLAGAFHGFPRLLKNWIGGGAAAAVLALLGVGIYKLMFADSQTIVAFMLTPAKYPVEKAESYPAIIQADSENTYIGVAVGDSNFKMLWHDRTNRSGTAEFGLKNCPADRWRDCQVTPFSVPTVLLASARLRHRLNTGSGENLTVTWAGKTCAIFPGPDPFTAPTNYVGTKACAIEKPKNTNTPGISFGWWRLISEAWAQGSPPSLVSIQSKLSSESATERSQGRLELQRASDASNLLDELISRPAESNQGPLEARILANALLSAVYFGDDKWKSVKKSTKDKIIAHLTDNDQTASTYARSVLRRYPEDWILAEVKSRADVATGEDKRKLLLAAADIEYNLGVVKLREARAAKTDTEKWSDTIKLFKGGAAVGAATFGDPAGSLSKLPDVQKNYFGIALATADSWTFAAKFNDVGQKDITARFDEFLKVVGDNYVYVEQTDAATCVTQLDAALSEAKFKKGLAECLQFYR